MARGKAAEAAVAAPVRSTAAQLVLKHKRALALVRAEKDDANSAIKQRMKSAKDDGLPVKAFEAALKLGRMDPDEARRLYQDTGRMFEAMWPGVLQQKDLFDAVQPATAEERAEANRADIMLEGLAAGRNGKTGQRDHRYEAGSADAQAYEQGWCRGADAEFMSSDERDDERDHDGTDNSAGAEHTIQ